MEAVDALNERNHSFCMTVHPLSAQNEPLSFIPASNYTLCESMLLAALRISYDHVMLLMEGLAQEHELYFLQFWWEGHRCPCRVM